YIPLEKMGLHILRQRHWTGKQISSLDRHYLQLLDIVMMSSLVLLSAVLFTAKIQIKICIILKERLHSMVKRYRYRIPKYFIEDLFYGIHPISTDSRSSLAKKAKSE